MTDTMVPTDPKERVEIKTMLVEITKCMSKIDQQREQIKEIKAAVKEKFAIGNKTTGKLAKTMYEHSYADVQAENEHFAELWEMIVEGKKVDGAEAA